MIDPLPLDSTQDRAPLVSVLVPAYNHETYVIECLESIAALTYPRLELVVGDDCSQDRTYSLAQSWAAGRQHRFERTTVVRQRENLGIVGNIQFLFAQAQGKYIACLASDDRFVPSALEERVERFERNACVDGIFGNAQIISSNGRVLSARACPPALARLLSVPRIMVSSLLLHWGNMPGPVLMLRRTAVLHGGCVGVLPLGLLAEDKYIYLRLAAQGRLQFIDKTVAQYRLAQGSLSRPRPGDDFNTRANVQCDRIVMPLLSGWNRLVAHNRIARNTLEIDKATIRFYLLKLFFLRCWTFALRAALRAYAFFARGTASRQFSMPRPAPEKAEIDSSSMQAPLVTIVITTKDRHEDLAIALADLKRQSYENLEMLVIDDASQPPVAPVVHVAWPGARLIRHEQNCGINVRRNEGFRLATGKFILSLDDDCLLVDEQAISRSVEYMTETPQCAVVAYYVWNGKALPKGLDRSRVTPGNCLSFPGGGSFLRKQAIDETAGFREIYVTQGEETELSLQLLKKGWSVSFRPEILVHHRYSSLNRNRGKAWKHSLRNGIWTSLIHTPAHRLPMELAWKIAAGCWDGFRLLRFRLFAQALWEAVSGVREVLRYRQPLGPADLRRVDALRAYGVLPYEMFAEPRTERWKILWQLVDRWRNRLRDGSFYSKKKNAGRGLFPTHEHELQK